MFFIHSLCSTGSTETKGNETKGNEKQKCCVRYRLGIDKFRTYWKSSSLLDEPMTENVFDETSWFVDLMQRVSYGVSYGNCMLVGGVIGTITARICSEDRSLDSYDCNSIFFWWEQL